MRVLGQPHQYILHDCRADTPPLPLGPDANIDDFEEDGTIADDACEADRVPAIHRTNRVEASRQASGN